MTSRSVLVAAALLSFALPARAQLAPRSVAVEALAAAPVGGAAAPGVAQGVEATTWLDGTLDLVVRVTTGAGARTGDRGAARWWAGTAGLRWSLAPGPVRPQLGLEAGWSVGADGGSRAAVGATAGLEWFLVRDLALRGGAALRGDVGGAWRAEVGVAGALYF
jgi:hypothetical protein